MLKSVKNLLHKDGLIVLLVILTHMGVCLAVALTQWGALEKHSPQVVTLTLMEARHVVQRINVPKQISRKSSSEINAIEPDLPPSNNIQSESVLSDAFIPKSLPNRSALVNPKPPYPLVSRRMREQGAVYLQICINQNGIVDNATVVKSSGHKLLDQSALNTVKSWRFSAANTADALNECYRLPVHFSLEA